MKKVGMMAVVKMKRPLFTKKNREGSLDFAIDHQHWTLEDWKKVVRSDKTKINRLGWKWVWKKAGEGLSERLAEGSMKFGGGSLMMGGCMMWMELGMHARLMGGWIGSPTPRF